MIDPLDRPLTSITLAIVSAGWLAATFTGDILIAYALDALGVAALALAIVGAALRCETAKERRTMLESFWMMLFVSAIAGVVFWYIDGRLSTGILAALWVVGVFLMWYLYETKKMLESFLSALFGDDGQPRPGFAGAIKAIQREWGVWKEADEAVRTSGSFEWGEWKKADEEMRRSGDFPSN